MGLFSEFGVQKDQDYKAQPGGPGCPNPVYQQLLKNLRPSGSGTLVLRIGGNSTDDSTDAGTSPPSSDPYAGAKWDPALAQLYSVFDDGGIRIQYILGINLGNGDEQHPPPGYGNVDLAVKEAVYFASTMPAASVLGYEIGNEPNLYVKNGDRPDSSAYTNDDAGYDGGYWREFPTWQAAIEAQLDGGFPVVGTAWGGLNTLPDLQHFLEQERGHHLTAVTQHYYGTNIDALNKLADAGGPSAAAEYFLTEEAVSGTPASPGLPTEVGPLVQAAHDAGVELRIDELGTVSNGGYHGASDTFGTALWAVDEMFALASAGVDGVNWSQNDVPFDVTTDAAVPVDDYTQYRIPFDGGFYGTLSNFNFIAPFHFYSTFSSSCDYELILVSPVYYGLLLFANATTGAGTRILPVNLSLTTPLNLKAWATVDTTSNATRVVLINKEISAAGTIQVSLPGVTKVSVTRLLVPSQNCAPPGPTYMAQSGVTWGGQAIDSTGNLSGTSTAEYVSPDATGLFSIYLPATSAALVAPVP